VRSPSPVPERKLLESDDGCASASQFRRGCAPPCPQPDDTDVVPEFAHVASSRGNSQRLMSRLSSSIGANQPLR